MVFRETCLLRCTEIFKRLLFADFEQFFIFSCHKSFPFGVLILETRNYLPKLDTEEFLIKMKRSYFNYLFLLTSLCLLSSCAIAGDASALTLTPEKSKTGDKYEFCNENNTYYSDGKKRVAQKDLREVTIPAGGLLEVDGGKNGGISIEGENRSDILIRACVRSWAESEAEAVTAVNNTRIETSGVIRAVNNDAEAKFSVSYKILVPLQQDLKLSANNGGISIKSVEGTLNFETRNGGVSLKDVAGDVKGMTKNGGVSVKLSGSSYRGSGLDVETKNGGVKLVLPRNFAADVESGTVNGGFKSDFAELSVKKDDTNRWNRPKKVSASLNGGGAKIRVVTTNGGVKIASSE
jgi:hypothetical protein